MNAKVSLSHQSAAVLLGLCCVAMLTVASANATAATQADEFQADPATGSGSVIVHPQLGGQILGYDVDRNGTEGLLSEYVSLGNGNNNVATETFDLKTGKILKVVAKTLNTIDDYVTQGIFQHVGLVLYQHGAQNDFQNDFLTINPLSSGKFNGKWTPPIKKNYQLWTTSVSPEGMANIAAFQLSNDVGNTTAYIFSSNVVANTFGPQIRFAADRLTLLAYDSKTNQAVLAFTSTIHAAIETIDLTSGKKRSFKTVGFGAVQGLAVDSASGTACITLLGSPFTPPTVEFYDLAKQTGFAVNMPGLNVGLDVEFDHIHKLFLVAETDFVNSGILVYDENGSLKETIPVQELPVSPSLIALNPSKRIGFVPVIVEPQHEFLELQSFRY